MCRHPKILYVFIVTEVHYKQHNKVITIWKRVSNGNWKAAWLSLRVCTSSDTVVTAWPTRIMLKVTGSIMPGILSMLPITVSAATTDGKQESATPLNRDELSLYTVPQQKFQYAEPEAGELEQSVATLRKLVEPYTAWCQGTYDKIKPKVQSVVDFGNDTCAYLKNPPKDFYPRAGVIGFTGVLGLFLARGSRIKKLIYPTALMTVSASLYYPEQAATIAKSTGECVYDCAVKSYVAVEKILKPWRKTDSEMDAWSSQWDLAIRNHTATFSWYCRLTCATSTFSHVCDFLMPTFCTKLHM